MLPKVNVKKLRSKVKIEDLAASDVAKYFCLSITLKGFILQSFQKLFGALY